MSPSADPFESRLEALFADPRPAPDAEAFALAVERRLASEQRKRRLVFGACTAASGLGAGAVFMLSGAFAGSGRALASATASFSRMDANTLYQTGGVLAGLALFWGLSELMRADHSL